jgi:stage IV sporulation protein FB
MKVQEPLHTRLELRLRLFGTPVRISLLFWLAAALLGVRYYADPEIASVAWFAFWMAAVLASVLIHELGHILAGRLFGMHGQVVLHELGSMTLGVDELPHRWQRILVLLAGPLAGALIVAGVWALTYLPLPAWSAETRTAIAIAAKMVLVVNVFWTSINLLPLWPLDGGRVACEIGEGLFGSPGVTAALILCLADTVLLTLLAVTLLSLHLNVRFAVPLHVPEWIRETELSRLWHLEYGSLLLGCYLLWLRTFRALWGATKDGESDAPAGARGA